MVPVSSVVKGFCFQEVGNAARFLSPIPSNTMTTAQGPANSIVEIEMKKIPFLALALLAGVFAIPAHAQDAMKKDAAVKPADPELKVVLDSWNDIGRKLIAMAEDFPEDKYDFKPTPAQRSFAEQLLHAAGSTYYFTNPVMGQKPPAAEDPKRDHYKTKAEIVAFVKKAFADGAAAISRKGEKGLTTTVPS